MLIDSHAHLDDEQFSADCEEVIERARAAGIESIISVGVNLESSLSAAALAEKHEMVFAAAGVHPHDAADVPADILEQLRKLLVHDKVIAVGEIGLDYYRNLSPKEVQQVVFREQLALARETDLPVIIHDRDAHNDVLDILAADGLPKACGVMHCFSGNWEFAQRCMDLGLYISFAGPVTFHNAGDLIEVALKVPLDKILVETDCPYLSPEPYRGKRNEPAYVRYTAEKIASLRGLKNSVFAQAITNNTRELFYKIS